MVGNAIGADGGDVAMRPDAEIALIDGARRLVDVAGENALQPELRRRDVEAADAAEQVGEGP